MWNTYTDKGGVTMLNTKGGDLIKDENGKVCGIYATNADGETIQIDAKAVIMACGGFEESAKLLKMKGYNPGRCVFDGITGHDGSGIEAAWRAGAKSWLDQASLLENLDLWRVQDGKIAEHWDVMETIAPQDTWANDNGKF